MQLPSRCHKRTGRYCPANNAVSRAAYRAENGNVGNFEAVESNGIAFVQKQCLYQKVAVGMENPNMQLPSLCNKRTGRYGMGNNPISYAAYRADIGRFGNSKLSKTMVPPSPKSNVYVKR